MMNNESTTEQRLLMRIALLEEQNAGMFEVNYNLHMENARLLKLITEHTAKMLPLLESLKS